MGFITDTKIVKIEDVLDKTNRLLKRKDELFRTKTVEQVLEETPKVSVGLTNGVFDLLHFGHISSLDYCKQRCAHLIVLVNTDAKVKELKGPNRPFQNELDRARAVASLQCVDQVILWNEKRITNALKAINPDSWFKGGDYTLATLDGDEKDVAFDFGIQIVFVPILEGYSSTKIIEQGMGNQ